MIDLPRCAGPQIVALGSHLGMREASRRLEPMTACGTTSPFKPGRMNGRLPPNPAVGSAATGIAALDPNRPIARIRPLALPDPRRIATHHLTFVLHSPRPDLVTREMFG